MYKDAVLWLFCLDIDEKIVSELEILFTLFAVLQLCCQSTILYKYRKRFKVNKSTQINNVQESYAKRKDMWTAMDVNGNGYLSLAEVTKVYVISTFIYNVFSKSVSLFLYCLNKSTFRDFVCSFMLLHISHCSF